MKTSLLKSRWPVRVVLSILSIAALSHCFSCSKEDIPVPVENSGKHEIGQGLFIYDIKDSYMPFTIRPLSTDLGPYTDRGYPDQFLAGLNHLAGVKVGYRQFLVCHNASFVESNKDWWIYELLGAGQLGDQMSTGTWSHNYETLMGFQVGDKGYIFGQDSYGNHWWFIQEITAQGTLGQETAQGSWHNYYESVTPIYINGTTYLFFQTDDSDHYWFISRVSSDGQLTDVSTGYWGDSYECVTSVNVASKTYLFGENKMFAGSIPSSTWFIQEINADGTMGAETDRGEWQYFYHIISSYYIGNQPYIIGHSTTEGLWFIQKINAGGKMGEEVSHGSISSSDSYFYPFTLYEPGSLCYEIGWDLSKTTGSPTRGWSSIFKEPWSGETKWGGGAALADIDRDGGQKLDAVLTGIQWLNGSDRHYYKVAWNLDNTGKVSGWSQVFFGPDCGQMQAGAGADVADIDGNGIPDLVLMSVDDPEGANSFWYYIGWNMGTNGQVASWSSKIQVDGLGYSNAGGGAALGDIDKNGRPDLVLMGIDDTPEGNCFWYRVGRNLNTGGIATSWSSMIHAPFTLGWSTGGGGAALADVNGNGKLDLVLTGIDSPTGENPFWCYIGWDIDINGNVSGWSSRFIGPSPGDMTRGGGTAVGDIDKNGILDILLMSVDDPYGKD